MTASPVKWGVKMFNENKIIKNKQKAKKRGEEKRKHWDARIIKVGGGGKRNGC